jgi:asparagine synthase (glutamine-hydrolysing)
MFLCAFRPGGEPLHRADLFAHLAQLRRTGETEPASLFQGSFAAVTAAPTRMFRPLVAQWRGLIGVGDVRLDNRAEIAGFAGGGVPSAVTDLEVVLRAIDARGEKVIPALLGDFGFVVWDASACKLLAVRDAFGVKPLFYRTVRGVTMLSSRMDVLATSEEWDVEHISDLLTGLFAPRERTIWKDVRPVPAGGFMIQRGTVQEGRRYWSAQSFEPADTGDERALTEQFLSLFREGVRTRMAAPAATWSQLSGGLDSSSVVCMAQSLLGPGENLGGTLTIVDTLGSGDERKYADTVVRHHALRNEQVRDYWAWQDDADGPPMTDGPRPLYPFFARDRRMCDVIRKSSGRVVLSGFGSDHYLIGHLLYISDMAGRGRIGAAVRETARWAVQTRQSFWSMLHRHVVSPLVHGGRSSAESHEALPTWLHTRFASQHHLTERLPHARMRGDRMGTWFARRVQRDVQSVPAWTERWPYGPDVEVRYPFLYRPLVEAGLRLPVSMRIRPEGFKWILREAMRGILPEEVRRRRSKGTIDVRIAWSLERERHRLDALLRDPILAQLGCIEPARLRAAVDSARHGTERSLVFLMNALSLETWLAVRAGRWTASTHTAATAA